MIEAGVPGYEVATFNGIVAPAATPAPIIALLNKTINEGLQTPENKAAIGHLGAISNPGSPEEFSALIAANITNGCRWRNPRISASINRTRHGAETRRRPWPK